MGFTPPEMKPIEKQKEFRHWCQKVLPEIYDDSLSYAELLGKVSLKVNECIEKVNSFGGDVDKIDEIARELGEVKEQISGDEVELAEVAVKLESALISIGVIASAVSEKQDKLIAGAGITIADNVISAAGGAGNVESVNGKTGAVVLNAEDVGALPDTVDKLPNPHKLVFTGSITGEYDGSEDVTVNITGGGGGGAVYSVNGKAGTVVLNAEDVGALPTGYHDSTKQDAISDLNSIRRGAELGSTALQNVPDTYRTSEEQDIIDEALSDRINSIELSKFPNAVIVGSPRISGSNVNGFTTNDYMIFPFVVDVRGYNFSIDFCFRTGSDVATQQNILDSRFGVALAIQNGKGIMAMSSNGTSWDIGFMRGTKTIEPNKVYYARIAWDGQAYTGALSEDGQDYTTDMQFASTLGLYPTTIYIGGSPDLFGAGSAHPFSGGIDMSAAKLTVAGLEVWHGMDDPGLASRANVSLSNLDALGLAKFRAENLPYGSGNVGNAIDSINSIVSNPNLLDNPWFTVNQRGQESYTGTVYGYDRWLGRNPGLTVGVEEDCLHLTANSAYIDNNIIQRLGKTFTSNTVVTLSVIGKGNVGFCYYGVGKTTFNSREYELHSITFTIPAGTYNEDLYGIIVGIGENSTEDAYIKAVKLEYGSVSTLANDHAPDYATELLKCQRYYIETHNDGTNGIIAGYPITAQRNIGPNFPVPMRTTPNITLINPTTNNTGCVGDWYSDEDITAFAVFVNNERFTINCNNDGVVYYRYIANADL